MKRNHDLRVKLTKEEHENIKKKAEKAMLPVTVFARLLLLKSTVKQEVVKE